MDILASPGTMHRKKISGETVPEEREGSVKYGSQVIPSVENKKNELGSGEVVRIGVGSGETRTS